MLDGQLRLSEPVLHPAAATPRLGQIGIEHEGAIDQACANGEVANNKRQSPSAAAEHVCIILAEFERALSQPRRFRNLVRCARKPAVRFGVSVAVTRMTEGEGKI